MPELDLETLPEITDFPPEQRTSAVELLLQICHRQQREIIELREHVRQQAELIQRQADQIQLQAEKIALQAEQIQQLKDEIAILKGEKKRPQIKPSTLNRDSGDAAGTGGQKQRRRGKPGCRKTHKLKIHANEIVPPAHIPDGSELKGYEDYIVQDIEISLKNTRYRRARYETPEGKTITGQLPPEVAGSHFGPTLRSYILSQYYQQQVPQRLILKQLWEFGVRISAGELNRIITERHDQFHAEKQELLRVSLEVSSHINVDDTGARHRRIATEAALAASLIKNGPFAQLVIMSDDAGQFNIAGFLHALCWVHAERTINKMVCNSWGIVSRAAFGCYSHRQA